MAVVDAVRTTLGPRGMDKLIHTDRVRTQTFARAGLGLCRFFLQQQLGLVQGVTISNDGATIMKLLEIVHPAAKTLVDISLSQDAEVSLIASLK